MVRVLFAVTRLESNHYRFADFKSIVGRGVRVRKIVRFKSRTLNHRVSNVFRNIEKVNILN